MNKSTKLDKGRELDNGNVNNRSQQFLQLDNKLILDARKGQGMSL